MIAFILRDAALDSSSSKIDSYRFSIVGCISQNLSRLVSRSSSVDLDSYVANGLNKSLAVMLIAWTYSQANG